MTKTFFIILTMVFLSQSINAQSPQEAKPSFDCVKASTKAEKIICSDKSGELKNLDRYMAEVYTQLRKELKISKFPDKEQRLKDLLDSQRAFIKNLDKVNSITGAYEKRITQLLKLLGEVLDSNNKELCEYARKDQFDENKWQEVPPSVNPPFSIGFCAFGANNQYGVFYRYCTEKREIIKEEMAKAIKEKSPYIGFPRVYKRKIDINNDGVLDNVILSDGEYFSALWIYKNGKLDAKASDKIYGDDLHFHGEKTSYQIVMVNEVPHIAFTTYALPSNKISGIPEQAVFDSEIPILSYLTYGVMEFQGKNYITLWSGRFNFDENSTYPETRIYLLEGNKRELKCTY
ncbi:lysozyme inhibitor LprI family protein [Helicobacter trogontum]|uniref:lysozyme inhibitor LprI family protein n=1 Tax=Helicobacter trogontum TaxID=50960 RepID=UPI0034E8F0E7